jgi:hypothetical protein
MYLIVIIERCGAPSQLIRTTPATAIAPTAAASEMGKI